MDSNMYHSIQSAFVSSFGAATSADRSIRFALCVSRIRDFCSNMNFQSAYGEAKTVHKFMRELVGNSSNLFKEEKMSVISEFCSLGRVLIALCLNLGYFDDSISIHLEILETSNDSFTLSSCHVSIASLYIQLESWQCVLDHYKAALSIGHPESDLILVNIGNAYLKLFKFSDAISTYRRLTLPTCDSLFNLLLIQSGNEKTYFVQLIATRPSSMLLSLAGQILLFRNIVTPDWIINNLESSLSEEFLIYDYISKLKAGHWEDFTTLSFESGYAKKVAKCLSYFIAICSPQSVCIDDFDDTDEILVNLGILSGNSDCFKKVLLCDAFHIEADFNLKLMNVL